jgi:hypothetical protein
MKKFIMILAAMVCLTSCMTSNEDALYSLKLTWTEGGTSFLNTSTAAQQACSEINSKIKAFSKQYTKENWIETIHNGKFSKADKNARALYKTAASALDDLQNECNAIVKNIPAGSTGSFVFGEKLVLSRYNDAKDNVLEEKSFRVAYGE